MFTRESRNYNGRVSFKIPELGDLLKDIDDLRALFLVGGSVY